MSKITFNIDGEVSVRRSFRYLWMKSVKSFNPNFHCARCLVGNYSKQFGLNMVLGKDYSEPFFEGDIYYFCGVSTPYVHENNLHLAVIYSPGSTIEKKLYNGTLLTVKNAKEIKFNNEKALEKHQNKSKSFLTCRNFQFGSYYFE